MSSTASTLFDPCDWAKSLGRLRGVWLQLFHYHYSRHRPLIADDGQVRDHVRFFHSKSPRSDRIDEANHVLDWCVSHSSVHEAHHV